MIREIVGAIPLWSPCEGCDEAPALGRLGRVFSLHTSHFTFLAPFILSDKPLFFCLLQHLEVYSLSCYTTFLTEPFPDMSRSLFYRGHIYATQVFNPNPICHRHRVCVVIIVLHRLAVVLESRFSGGLLDHPESAFPLRHILRPDCRCGHWHQPLLRRSLHAHGPRNRRLAVWR